MSQSGCMILAAGPLLFLGCLFLCTPKESTVMVWFSGLFFGTTLGIAVTLLVSHLAWVPR